MKATGQRDTHAELSIRRLLHARGHRYRVDFNPIPGLRSRPDIVFTKKRLAVYIDGCFWHGCPEHGSSPKKNASFWRTKIEANQVRDARATECLRHAGWDVLRIWEHEDPEDAVRKIESSLLQLPQRSSS